MAAKQEKVKQHSIDRDHKSLEQLTIVMLELKDVMLVNVLSLYYECNFSCAYCITILPGLTLKFWNCRCSGSLLGYA